MTWMFAKLIGADRDERFFEPPEWSWAQTGDVGWWVRADWRQSLLGSDGLRLEEWRRDGRLRVIKTGPHRVVYRIDLPDGAVFVKHFLVPGWQTAIRQWFRRGKGRNEGRRTRYLDAIGVPTVTPIALGEQRRRKFLFENYLITPEISGSLPLNEFVERGLRELPEPQRTRVRQALAVELAVMTARLHDAGYVHQDFHPGNILVRLEGDSQPMLAMIDLDALRVCRKLTWKVVQKNLALLNHYFEAVATGRTGILHELHLAPGKTPSACRSTAAEVRARDRKGHAVMGGEALETLGPPLL